MELKLGHKDEEERNKKQGYTNIMQERRRRNLGKEL
jgi:hypothetical protein